VTAACGFWSVAARQRAERPAVGATLSAAFERADLHDAAAKIAALVAGDAGFQPTARR
jgi:hypothetical protein